MVRLRTLAYGCCSKVARPLTPSGAARRGLGLVVALARGARACRKGARRAQRTLRQHRMISSLLLRVLKHVGSSGCALTLRPLGPVQIPRWQGRPCEVCLWPVVLIWLIGQRGQRDHCFVFVRTIRRRSTVAERSFWRRLARRRTLSGTRALSTSAPRRCAGAAARRVRRRARWHSGVRL